MKKIIKTLSNIPMTIVGGVFLASSLVLSMCKVKIYFDPALITVFICGIPLFYMAISRIVHEKGISKISSDLLISIAMCAAIAIGDLFAAGEVAFIMAIGTILEEKTTKRARKGIKKLMDLSPHMARKIVGGTEEMVETENLKVGDIVRVLPGEIVPADGEVVLGETSIDQSVMTGESIPVDKSRGDMVFCGTLNRFGAVDVEVKKESKDSSLQDMIRMVEEADKNKAPAQRIADRCASFMVPSALIIAVVTFLITLDVTRAVAVMVVFCPCALVLATPTAIMAAVGQAAKHGVIIKSPEALENMRCVDTVTFDKTGTLTYGKLDVSDIVVFDKNIDENTALSLVASAEAKSEHPLGKAIVAYAQKNGIAINDTDEFEMEQGKGVFARIGKRNILCGSQRFILEHGIDVGADEILTLKSFRSEGKASVLMALDKVCVCAIGLSDVIKSEAKDMVKKLSFMNTKTLLLTGDNYEAAKYFAKKSGIANVRAQLLPDEKVKAVKELEDLGHKVCMIGDGVNDSPALKTASVGIAMGKMGSDIAVEAADITLMSDDISKLPYLKRLSCATIRTIGLSISIAMTINMIALVLSVLGMMSPTVGALVHNAGSCFVVLLAALLYDRKLDDCRACIGCRKRKRNIKRGDG